MKLDKPYTRKQYADFASECNRTHCHIVDCGTYLLAVSDEKTPTMEEQKKAMRNLRNEYLEKYVDPKQLVLVWDSLGLEDRKKYKEYRRYLLEYPNTSKMWYKNPPLTLSEWEEQRN